MTSTAPRPVADKSRSLTQISDDLSVLKADSSINDALDNLYSDDPELQASGEAQLQALITTESDLREGCNRLLWSAERDEQEAHSVDGTIQGLEETVRRLKAQKERYLRRAADKRIYAGGHLDHHFPNEKTHPTPFGNLKLQRSKDLKVVNTAGEPLKVKDIPPDYKYLIFQKEVTTTSTKSFIDEEKILNSMKEGNKFPFARFKKPTPRFY